MAASKTAAGGLPGTANTSTGMMAPPHAGIVSGLGGRQALDGSFAEFFRRFAGATGKVVGHERGDIFPDPRNRAYKYTDQSGANNIFPVIEQISYAGSPRLTGALKF